MTARYFRLAAAVCVVLGAVTFGSFVVALFDPPSWNRAERLVQAWTWFYVAYLHGLLATHETHEGDA